MSLARLEEFLDGHSINYVNYLVVSHWLPYTAQQTAELTHIPGRELAKAVIVKIDGTLAMAVVPACSKVDLSRWGRLRMQPLLSLRRGVNS